MPRGGGLENVPTFGILSKLALILTFPRKRGGTHFRTDMRSLDMSDLTQSEKIVPGPVAGIFYWLVTSGREL